MGLHIGLPVRPTLVAVSARDPGRLLNNVLLLVSSSSKTSQSKASVTGVALLSRLSRLAGVRIVVLPAETGGVKTPLPPSLLLPLLFQPPIVRLDLVVEVKVEGEVEGEVDVEVVAEVLKLELESGLGGKCSGNK